MPWHQIANGSLAAKERHVLSACRHGSLGCLFFAFFYALLMYGTSPQRRRAIYFKMKNEETIKRFRSISIAHKQSAFMSYLQKGALVAYVKNIASPLFAQEMRNFFFIHFRWRPPVPARRRGTRRLGKGKKEGLPCKAVACGMCQEQDDLSLLVYLVL